MIAILCDYEEGSHSSTYVLKEAYFQALLKAGGKGCIVPYGEAKSYLDHFSGLLLTGGNFTIDPSLFGEVYDNPLPLKVKRTEAELAFFHEAFSRSMPILGICGGAQLINVALGGSLIQHIPTTLPNSLRHSGLPPTVHSHDVTLVPHTFLSDLVQEKCLPTNSSHLQSIGRLGRGVKVNAVAPDTVIEGIEVEAYPFCLGTQWHPEYSTTPLWDEPLFTSFVAASSSYLNP